MSSSRARSEQTSGVSHTVVSELKQRVDARPDYEATTNEKNNDIDERRRMTRRSKSRSVEPDDTERQHDVNKTTPLALNHIDLTQGERAEKVEGVHLKHCSPVESGWDRESAKKSMTDESQSGVATAVSPGSHPGDKHSTKKKGVKRRLNSDPVVTKSGRVVKKTAVAEMHGELEEWSQRPRKPVAKAPRLEVNLPAAPAAKPELEKPKTVEEILVVEQKGPPSKRYFLSGVYSDCKGREPTRCISVIGHGESSAVTSSQEQAAIGPPAKKSRGKLKWPHPVFFGNVVMRQGSHFQLPFPVWWQLNNSKLRVRTIGEDDDSSEFEYDPPMEYKEIRSNIFVDIKCSPAVEHSICECKPPSEPDVMGCGDDCLNRMILTECNSKHCPCGERCSNMRFQKHEWVQRLKKFRTKDRGYGVTTTVALKAHQFVIEYCGEVISERLYRARVLKKYKRQRHHYCLSLEGGIIIDGHSMGSKARFVNHCCDPNCEMQKWSVNGVDRMGLFALRDIPAGQELTYDYNFDPLDNVPQKCLCGSAKCRGFIGSKHGQSRRSKLLGREFVFRNPCRGQKRRLLTDNSKNGSDKGDAKEKKTKRHHGHKKKQSESARQSSSVKQSMPLKQSKPEQALFPFLFYKPMSLRERNCVMRHRIFLLKSLVQTVENFESVLSDLQKTELQRSLSMSSYSRRGHFQTLVPCTQSETNRSEMQELIVNIFSGLFHYEDENKVNLSAYLKDVAAKNMMSFRNGLQPAIDLNTVESRLLSGEYMTLDDFCADFELALKMAVEQSHGSRRVKVTQCADKLGSVYRRMRSDNEIRLTGAYDTETEDQDSEVSADDEAMRIGETAFIRCICEMPLDEGFMVQCDRCKAWQHGDCMGYSPQENKKSAVYYCEKCSYRTVDRNIVERPQPQGGVPGCTYYLTFWHNSCLVKKGGCVYTSRDHSMSWQNGKKRSCNRTLGLKHKDQLDIFRVLGLWQDENSERFVFGFHYFRPHEVSHSAGKRFYPNEVIQTSLYEIIPLEAVVAQCVVMDLYSYVRGRPINVDEKDVYVCELACAKSEPKLKKIPRRQVKFPFPTNPAVYGRFSEPVKLHRSVLANPDEVKILDAKRSRKQSTPKRSQFQRSPNQKAQAAKRRAAYQEKKVYGPGERVDDIASRLTERVQRKRFLTAGKSERCGMDVRSEQDISSGVLQNS